jgi:hypothetical protein
MAIKYNETFQIIIVFVICATLAVPVFAGSLTLPSQEQQQGNGLVLLSSSAFYKPDSSFGSREYELHIVGEIMNSSNMPSDRSFCGKCGSALKRSEDALIPLES